MLGYRFKASLGYVVCLCPKQKQTKKNNFKGVCRTEVAYAEHK